MATYVRVVVHVKKECRTAMPIQAKLSHKDSNLIDLGLAFDQLGIQVCELDDYVHQVEPIHLPKTPVQYPVNCEPHLKFPTEDQVSTRDEYYDDHLPPFDKVIENEDSKGDIIAAGEVENKEENLQQDAIPKALPSELMKRENRESPIYSPVEQKSFNIGPSSKTPDVIRSDLKVATSIEVEREAVTPLPKWHSDPFSRKQEPVQNTAEKRPASHLDSPTHANAPRHSPVPAKRSKLLLASPENVSKSENKDEFGLRDNTPSLVDKSALHIPIDKHTGEFQKSTVFTPEDSNSSFKDVEPFASKSSKLTEHSTGSMSEQSQLTPLLSNQSNILKEGNSIKAEKKTKKEKKTKSKKSSGKHGVKKSASSNLLGSPQLFTSPHLLKSPSEPRISAMPSTSTPIPATVQKLQVKPMNISPSPKSSKSKVKDLASTPTSQSFSETNSKLMSMDKKMKKLKKKHADREEKLKRDAENEKKSLVSQNAADQSWKQSYTSSDSIESPATSKSSLFSSSMQSQHEILSPNAAKLKLPEEPGKKDHGEKKHKKDKKAKKKEKLESGSKSKEDKKSVTPSLKLTFKRSSAPLQKEPNTSSSSPSLQFHGVSASPYDLPSKGVAPSTPQPKQKKSKKEKPSKITTPVLPKVEVGVKIEPLVADESVGGFETPRPKSSGKKSDSKRGHSSKKGDSSKSDSSPKKKESSSKKSESSKKTTESGKKSSSKKSESSRKGSSSSKKPESSSAGYLASTPNPLAAATTPTAEQSVSRGLFIQTITEPPTSQVWYCPSCLRPDDGSPMIGCDSCDGWYHWTCVGITEDPVGDAEWFCSCCIEKMSKKKLKKRKKKE
eukprot:gene7213-8021_t